MRSESRGRRGYLLPIPSARRGEAVTVRGAGGLNREEGNMCSLHTPRRTGSKRNFIEISILYGYILPVTVHFRFSWMDENVLEAFIVVLFSQVTVFFSHHRSVHGTFSE